MEDWEVTLTSSHRGALSRQVTEACRISSEGLGSLLNKKNEYGGNALTEMAVVKGDFVVGEGKRKWGEEKAKTKNENEVSMAPKKEELLVKKKPGMKLLTRVAPKSTQRTIKEMVEIMEKKKAREVAEEEEEKRKRNASHHSKD